MTYASKLTALSPLIALHDLIGLVLDPANWLTDLAPLESMPALRWVALEGKALVDSRTAKPMTNEAAVDTFEAVLVLSPRAATPDCDRTV